MGLLWSRTRALDDLATQVESALHRIDGEITTVTNCLVLCQRRQRQASRSLLLYATFIVPIIAIVTYASYHKQEDEGLARRRAFLGGIIVVVVLVAVGRSVDAYYNRRASHYTRTLQRLQLQRKAVKEDFVKKTNFHRLEHIFKENDSVSTNQMPQSTQQGAQRPQALQPEKAVPPSPLAQAVIDKRLPTPRSTAVVAKANTGPSRTENHKKRVNLKPHHERTDYALAVPQQRNLLDRVVDFLLNDGPNNRFALVCRKCFCHNGLVREEQLNLSFRCGICHFMNTPIKSGGNVSEKSNIDIPLQQHSQMQLNQQQHHASPISTPTTSSHASSALILAPSESTSDLNGTDSTIVASKEIDSVPLKEEKSETS